MDQGLCSLPLSFNVFLKVEKVEFSAQDSDLEYLCWRCKNSPVSSDLKLPLEVLFILHTSSYFTNSRFKLDLKDPMYI